MRITKNRLKEIIKEEAEKLREVEYGPDGPMYYEPKGEERSPEDAEVLVQGYGGLRIEQIRRRLREMHQQIAEDKTLATLSYYLGRGVMAAFVKTLSDHNALLPPEETIEITEGNFQEEYCRQNPNAEGCLEYWQEEARAEGIDEDDVDFEDVDALIFAIEKVVS